MGDVLLGKGRGGGRLLEGLKDIFEVMSLLLLWTEDE